MRIDDDARLLLTWEATSNLDLADATLTMRVGEVVYPMQWTAAASQEGGLWSRRAQSEVMFTGSNVPPGDGDVALPPGRYACEAILAFPDGQIVPARPFTLTVA